MHAMRRPARVPRRDLGWAVLTAAAVPGAALLEGAPASMGLALLSAGVAAPLASRRLYPVTVALACAAVAVGGVGIPEWSGRLVAMAAFCSAAYHTGRPALLLALSGGWSAALLLAAVRPAGVAALAESVLVGIAPVAVGLALRAGREQARQTARLHRAEAVRAVAEEHGRLAREVHDAVGHHLTAIRMQAGAARHVLPGPELPPVAGAALDTIDGLAAVALADVRALLDDLRAGPSLADRAAVRALAARLGCAACPVRDTDDDPDVALSPAVARGGYRMLQEAVTNAVRHADAGAVEVLVRRGRRRSRSR